MADHVIRDPGSHAPGISVVIASNEQGRIEPFAFEKRKDAESFAESIEGRGYVNVALVYHGVDVMNEFTMRRTVLEVHKLWS